jgi:hypothetical protein
MNYGLIIPSLLALASTAVSASANESGNSHPKEKKGILTIESPTTENPEMQRLAKDLEGLKKESRELRSQILAIQDRLASRVRDISELQIDFVTQNPADKTIAPLAIMELQVAINEVEVVHYLNPPQVERDLQLPLFLGPIPSGTYKLRVKGVLGILQHDWPYALAQGRWSIDKTFTLKLDQPNQRKVATITARPAGVEPTLTLNEKTETRQ